MTPEGGQAVTLDELLAEVDRLNALSQHDPSRENEVMGELARRLKVARKAMHEWRGLYRDHSSCSCENCNRLEEMLREIEGGE